MKYAEPHGSHRPVTQPTGKSNPTGQAPTVNITGDINETGILERFEIRFHVESVPNHGRHQAWQWILLSDSSLDHVRPQATKYKGLEYARIN